MRDLGASYVESINLTSFNKAESIYLFISLFFFKFHFKGFLISNLKAIFFGQKQTKVQVLLLICHLLAQSCHLSSCFKCAPRSIFLVLNIFASLGSFFFLQPHRNHFCLHVLLACIHLQFCSLLSNVGCFQIRAHYSKDINPHFVPMKIIQEIIKHPFIELHIFCFSFLA